MSTIIKTEAIVIRSVDFRDTSKIVTFYTEQFGKVAGIVKGARLSKNKYGSSLQLMSYVSLIMYKKEGREVQTVSNCDLLVPLGSLSQDLDKMAVGMAVIELLDHVTQGEEQNPHLFELVKDTLIFLNDATDNFQNLLYFFEYRLVDLLGFKPLFDECVNCRKPLESIREGMIYRFHIEMGGIICRKCSNIGGNKFGLSYDVLRIFKTVFSSNNIDTIVRTKVEKNTMTAIDNFLMLYLRHHVAGLGELKTNKVFSRILKKA